jgi:DNA-damage-inducible protein D
LDDSRRRARGELGAHFVWGESWDVCAVLTGSVDAGAYWRKLKQRLVAESAQPVTFCHG